VTVAGVPVEPTREEARAQALEELAKREYADARPGLLERAVTRAQELLDGLGGAAGPVSLLILGVVAAVIIALVVWGLYRAGGVGRTARRRAEAVLSDRATTAAEHRAAADAAAAAGRWDDAVRHRFRAIARTLEDEAVLTPQPGRTADEVAREGGTRLPGLAAALLAGARTFDDVAYGDRHVDAAADRRMRDLDAQVRAARVTDARPAGVP
jgi:hypothetical protein